MNAVSAEFIGPVDLQRLLPAVQRRPGVTVSTTHEPAIVRVPAGSDSILFADQAHRDPRWVLAEPQGVGSRLLRWLTSSPSW